MKKSIKRVILNLFITLNKFSNFIQKYDISKYTEVVLQLILPVNNFVVAFILFFYNKSFDLTNWILTTEKKQSLNLKLFNQLYF